MSGLLQQIRAQALPCKTLLSIGTHPKFGCPPARSSTSHVRAVERRGGVVQRSELHPGCLGTVTQNFLNKMPEFHK